jgi:hypothetical protein
MSQTSLSLLDTAQKHPLIRKFPIITAPIREAYAQAKFVLVCGGDSCCFQSVTQSGKSVARRLIAKWIAADFPGIILIVFSLCRTSGRNSNENLKAFAKQIPDCMSGDTADKLRGRIKKALLNIALTQGCTKIVLLLDEGQAITNHECDFLKDLFNDLEDEWISLVTIVFSQEPQIGEKISNLMKDGRGDLVRRIFGPSKKFRDLRLDELRELFRYIDDAVWEESGNQHWPEFYVPNAWKKKWRLENEVDFFIVVARKRGAMKSYIASDGKKIETISAGIVVKSIRHFFSAAKAYDCEDLEKWPEDRWDNAIAGALSETGSPPDHDDDYVVTT